MNKQYSEYQYQLKKDLSYLLILACLLIKDTTPYSDIDTRGYNDDL